MRTESVIAQVSTSATTAEHKTERQEWLRRRVAGRVAHDEPRFERYREVAP
jgi:hypothetical protein